MNSRRPNTSRKKLLWEKKIAILREGDEKRGRFSAKLYVPPVKIGVNKTQFRSDGRSSQSYFTMMAGFKVHLVVILILIGALAGPHRAIAQAAPTNSEESQKKKQPKFITRPPAGRDADGDETKPRNTEAAKAAPANKASEKKEAKKPTKAAATKSTDEGAS